MRIAATADLHYSKDDADGFQSFFREIAARADVLLIAGDLTTHGVPEEAQALVKQLRAIINIPAIAVLGNHDFEVGKENEIKEVLKEAGIHVLDGDTFEYQGVGFAGTKGFAGGFGQRALEPWGEPAIKQFVREAEEETLKLESALARLRTPQRIAVLHYSPIQATVEGEPLEIYAFLGSSRLEEPLNRYAVSAVFHGHAHHGAPEGRTSGNIPVYNVSMSLLGRTYPDRAPFRLLEIHPMPTNEGELPRSPSAPSRKEAQKAQKT